MKILFASLICCFLFVGSTPSQDDVHIDKGTQFMDEFKYPEAIAEFDLSILINPKNWLAYYDRSICYGEINERKKAFDGYVKAYSLKKSAVTSNGLGIGHLGLHRFEQAKRYFAIAIKLDKSDHIGFYNMGFALNREKKYEEALRYFNLALGLKSDHVNTKLSKMDVLFSLKQYEACFQETGSLVSLGEEAIDVYEYMGRSLVKLHRFELAIVAFNKALIIDPENLTSILYRAEANKNLERYEEEIADRTTVLNAFVEAKESNFIIGQSFFFRGTAKGNSDDHTGAIQDYNKSLEYEPNQGGTYFNRAVAKINVGDLEGACQDYHKAVLLEPASEEIFKTYLLEDPGVFDDFLKYCDIGEALPDFKSSIKRHKMIKI
jgi:tetratricopeptide (TPR) repeat protein